MFRSRICSVAVATLALVALVATPARTQDPSPRVDYLTFAQGAIPIAIGGVGATRGAAIEHALRLVDGDPGGYPFVNRADDATDTEFVYELPAPTTFDRFAVPEVLETPSPSQTFTRQVEVLGSASGPDGPYTRLAFGELTTHPALGMETELPVVSTIPVRWVKVRLVGGIEMLSPQMFLEISEIIGNGTQESPPLAENFVGIWRAPGLLIQLFQDGAAVVGCYDRTGDLQGTVTGNILRATGVARSTGVLSSFVLNIAGDGTLRGVASTNGAPFRMYSGPPAAAGTDAGCQTPPRPVVGCGSTIHGITFDYDAAVIRPESGTILDALADGLRADASGAVRIVGHTSSEGEEAYNQALSERRAAAVVAALVERGIAVARLSAAGRGESLPIAPNSDETGRSLNRRVEIECS